MLVLGSLLIISTIVVEFAYNAHIAYDVAATQRDRLRAEYLAQSAANLTRLALRSERELRTRFASLLSQLGSSEVTSDPFCKLFPISTGILQGIGQGSLPGLTNAEGETENESGEKPPEENPPVDETEEQPDLMNLGGDFMGSCDTEERKINLNAFAQPLLPEGGPSAPTASYEDQKNLLYTLLTQPEFEKLFEGKREKIRDVVNAIADWADADDQINEALGIAGGYEESLYGDLDYKPKNGRYLSPQELLLVPGVGDDLFRLLEPHVTVYGDNKINLCQGDEALIRAFLIHYSQTTPGASPLNPEDERTMGAVLESVRLACQQQNPQPMQVAQAISSVLGGSPGSAATARRSARSPRRGEPSEPSDEAGSPAPAATGASGLVSRISTQNRFYRIQAVGTVGETEVRILTVIDTQTVDPNLWKTLYFRAE